MEVLRHVAEASEHESVAMGRPQVDAPNGEAKLGEAVEQRGEGDAGLEPRQRSAETEVDAVTEAAMRPRWAGDVEPVRLVDDLGIPVGGGEADEHLPADRELDAAELGGIGGVPEGGLEAGASNRRR
jgi:hypothetical protein